MTMLYEPEIVIDHSTTQKTMRTTGCTQAYLGPWQKSMSFDKH